MYWFLPGQPVVGRTERVQGPVVPGKSGLQASKTILNALLKTPAKPSLCRVEMSGTVVVCGEWIYATERTPVAALSVDQTIQMFRRCAARLALQCADHWEIPKPIDELLITLNPAAVPAALDELYKLDLAAFSGRPLAWTGAFTASWAVLAWVPTALEPHTINEVRHAAMLVAETAAWEAAGEHNENGRWLAAYTRMLQDIEQDLRQEFEASLSYESVEN